MTDTNRLDWLAEHCYLPDDHPGSGVFVVVDDLVAPTGSFPFSQEICRSSLRKAIDQMIAREAASCQE